MTIDKGEIKQNEFTEVLDKLKVYPARGYKCIDLKESVSKNTKNFYDGWKKICYGFKMEYYHFLKRLVWKPIYQQPYILDAPEQKKINDFFTPD